MWYGLPEEWAKTDFVGVVVIVLDDRSDLTVTTNGVHVAHSSQPIILCATAAIT